ncbi:MAG: diguanylate cyclase, partial [Alphaproteobacteria bacterium]|nr:diguanylate cyclase [Alphaproteobacteria bacterium]
IDRNELLARVRVLLRSKRYADRLRDKVQQSIELAIVDPLTGLNNRRFLENHLAATLEQARARHKPVSLMILDIDHFKRVNDTYGHAAGDDVLRELASRTLRGMRSFDLVARLGGEEFLVVMPETNLAIAANIAERLRLSVANEPFTLRSNNLRVPITVSIGVAVSRESGENAEDLLKRADDGLYAAKNAGRNRVVALAADAASDAPAPIAVAS